MNTSGTELFEVFLGCVSPYLHDRIRFAMALCFLKPPLLLSVRHKHDSHLSFSAHVSL